MAGWFIFESQVHVSGTLQARLSSAPGDRKEPSPGPTTFREMISANEFRAELRARLQNHADEVLLRILLSDGNLVELTGGAILREAERLAILSTVAVGRVVLLLLPHSVELFLMHIGLVLTGRIPAILPWATSRMDPEKYQGNLLHQFSNLPSEEIITTPTLSSYLGMKLPYRVVACGIESVEYSEVAFSAEPHASLNGQAQLSGLPLQDLGEAVFLQFSGGTTGAQKAVVITAPILKCQLEHLGQSLSFSSADTVVSWLPLYHDMGLIACLWLPLWHTALSVHFSASDWLVNPGLLFEFLERHSGTFCWLPNFAFSYLASQRKRIAGPHSLGHVRAYIDCSEPVRSDSIQRFAAAFADWGVSTQQVQASYALAENVFAVTQTELGQKPSTFPRTALKKERDQVPLAFQSIDDLYVSSGAPMDGMLVRTVNLKGDVCGEREPGEIQLATESLFSGYWGPQGFTTNIFTSDGWYPTGDYGFLENGELYVIGRLKDIVIVGGQNIFPEDVEFVVNTVPGVYAGRVVAFGVVNTHDTESLIVIAEMKGAYDADRASAIEKEIARLVLKATGTAATRVWVLPERWIVKSTAGKISRRETRERYLRELKNPSQRRLAVVEAN